jgi:hypothetical protein
MGHSIFKGKLFWTKNTIIQVVSKQLVAELGVARKFEVSK